MKKEVRKISTLTLFNLDPEAVFQTRMTSRLTALFTHALTLLTFRSEEKE
jgi:hypothetical protein